MVYRRYASLYFIVGVEESGNELLALEEIHLFVEVLDRYFGNVCELDIIFNFHRAYAVLFEVIQGGYIVEGSKNEGEGGWRAGAKRQLDMSNLSLSRHFPQPPQPSSRLASRISSSRR